MLPSTWKQSYALIWRYLISIRITPICSAIRIIWPAFILGLDAYLLSGGDIFSKVYVSILPNILRMTTLFHLYSFCAYMVTDRENGFKSLLLSMGMRRRSYYIAHIFCILIFVLPIVVSLSYISTTYAFNGPNDSQAVFYLLFILISLQITSYSFVFTTFQTTTKYITILYLIYLLDAFGLHQLVIFISKQISQDIRPTLWFVASISPYESVQLFVDTHITNNPPQDPRIPIMEEDKPFITNQPVYLILIATTFWTLVGFAFARWFDEVCPWQKDSAIKNSMFFISAAYKSNLINDEEQVLRSDLKYFEHRRNHRETGIEVRHITKLYDGLPAVDDVSFKIYKGETTLLLGHNGAGKTTLMNIILNLLTPNNGTVKIQNFADNRPPIGVCPQNSILDANLTVMQHLELFADIKSNLNGTTLTEHIRDTLFDISLQSHARKKPSELSGGMKRKLSLGMAFVGQSNVLILDEPSSGLDPDSRTYIWDTIRRYRNDRTVLLSTQHMEEADNLGDRIAIMSTGKIFCCGSSHFLKKIFGTGYKLRIECKRSQQLQILSLVKTYFDRAHLRQDQENSGEQDPNALTNFELELDESDTAKNYEELLTRLLERIEEESNQLGIKTFGLKSSSIEDVMLNTGKYLDRTTHSEANTRKKDLITFLTHFSVHSSGSCSSKNLRFLYALFVKHLQTFCADWLTVLLLRILLPISASYVIATSFGKKSSYQPSFYPILFAYHFMYYTTLESSSKFKIIQLTSRANFIVYWISQVCIDIFTIFTAIIALNIFVRTSTKFDLMPPVSDFQLHLVITSIIFLFGLAVMSFAYTLSNLLGESPKSASGYFLLICFSSYMIYFIMLIIKTALNANYNYDAGWLVDVFSYIFIAILPTDAVEYAFYGVDRSCYFSTGDCISNPATQNSAPLLAGLIVLALQIVVYTSLLYIIERQYVDLEWYLKPANICPCFRKVVPYRGEHRELDKDVLDEGTLANNLINRPSSDHKSLICSGLHKSYNRGVPVLENLSFTAKKKECFGLLGVNGAGKSTTFSLLATERRADRGKIWGEGYFSTDINHYRASISYDPQQSPDMQLSPVQALFLMARLREVDEASIPILVKNILQVLDMSQHADKPTQKLSGGTKRKLALGMSLIGAPHLSFLDEPTAGVDPLARRGVWDLLKALRTEAGSSIVISSHAMEECEAICDRIAIMARGKLRCIGTYLQLHSKFAHGFILKVQFGITDSRKGSDDTTAQVAARKASSESSHRLNVDNIGPSLLIEELKSLLLTSIGSCFTIADQHTDSVTIRITDANVRRSTVLRGMLGFKNRYPSIHYTINDSSLEDIFISIAREKQELDKRCTNVVNF